MISRLKHTQSINYSKKNNQIKPLLVGTALLLFCIFLINRYSVPLIKAVLTPVSVVSKVTGQKLKSTEGRTNILLLGVDRRPGMTGGLTDTIILASFSAIEKNARLISIPRDLWIATEKTKINSLYSIGGVDLLKSTVQKILGLDVHYFAVVDFSTFIKIVDLLGGIDIDVPIAFTDNYYPIAGREDDLCGITPTPEATESSEFSYPCRFERLHFDKGSVYLDGKTALKYVRSRHSEGNTGSDFARAARQQQIIEAVSKKALSWETLLNPVKMKEIFDSFVSGVETDLGFWEAERFYNIGKDFNFGNISTIVLDTNNLLTHPVPSEATGFQWVLLPRAGDFSEITLFVQKLFYGVGEDR